MDITLNGKPAAVAENLTVAGLVQDRNLDPVRLVAEHNGAVLPRETWRKTVLKSGDALELVSMVGGG